MLLGGRLKTAEAHLKVVLLELLEGHFEFHAVEFLLPAFKDEDVLEYPQPILDVALEDILFDSEVTDPNAFKQKIQVEVTNILDLVDMAGDVKLIEESFLEGKALGVWWRELLNE